MKKMQCEVCGSNEIKKIDDSTFECQSCGVQYSKNELQKLLVEITGNVKIDHSQEVENAIKRAEQFENDGDSQKAKDLFLDEVNAFYQLSIGKKKIFCGLLYNHKEFQGFFDYVEFKPYSYKMTQMILEEYKGRVCANADIDILIKHYPVELAYALALIGSNDYSSITPPWLLKNYPN